MRILWLGNAPFVGSGYGEQAALFLPRLRDQGHDLAVATNFGLQGNRSSWGGFLCYPADGKWGNLSVSTYARDHKADLVLVLHDAWVLNPDDWDPDLRVAVWAPIDHYPIPPAVLAVLSCPQIKPIAMSRFGQKIMADCGLDPLYVPHGVDTALFRPQPEIKRGVRAELGIPEDAFLVGMVAANKGNPSIPRKSFPQAFHAFSQFAKDHKDAWMYVHTEATPNGGGINLERLAKAVNMPGDRLKFPPAEAWHLGMPASLVANLYQAFDVLLNPSMGEGFGVPVLEAQACGVPVIASDHSAMTELAHAGWLVGGDPWWDALQDSFLIVPSIDAIHSALEDAYAHRDDQELKDSAAAFAQGYDADLVAEEYWRPALAALDLPREVPPLNGGLNRAQRRAMAKKQKAAA